LISGFEGIKIIETASVIAGPLVGRLLGDLGADVIHIERPSPNNMNHSVKHSNKNLQGGRQIESHINYINENTNCNKRSMTLDITSKIGHEILYRMLETADVYLSNFRPYELKKFGLEYCDISKLNKRIIHANLTGYGIKGPDSDLPGYDFNTFWTRSGIMHEMLIPGMTPFSTPIGLGDRVTSLALAYGITSALFIRERTGIGQEIDTSLLQAAVFVNANDVGGALVTGKDRQNVERDKLANALLNSYRTKDGRWLRIAINQPDRYWGRFCKTIDRPDLEENSLFRAFEDRIQNHQILFNILEETFAKKTLQEWQVSLTEDKIPWGPISTLPEVVCDVQATENKFFVSYDHPAYGNIEIVGNPVNFHKTPAKIKRPAPMPSQHTKEILLEYEYSNEEITHFQQLGVVS